MMNKDEILAALVNCKGTYLRAEWKTTVRTSAANSERIITKHTVATVRAGIDFANMKSNEEREVGPLPFGEWVAFPYLIQHGASYYARLTPTKNKEQRATVIFSIDGRESTREQVAELLTPSDAKKLLDHSKVLDCFVVKDCNLISLNA